MVIVNTTRIISYFKLFIFSRGEFYAITPHCYMRCSSDIVFFTNLNNIAYPSDSFITKLSFYINHPVGVFTDCPLNDCSVEKNETNKSKKQQNLPFLVIGFSYKILYLKPLVFNNKGHLLMVPFHPLLNATLGQFL